MATQKVVYQSTGEIRTHYIDLTNDLPTGITVLSAAATHTPPSGAAVTPTCAVSSPVVAVTVPAITVSGVHTVKVLAPLSNGDKSEVILIIPIKW